VTRALAVAALAAAGALVTGCDQAKTIAGKTGLGGFEARCEASLPPARVDVVAAPAAYKIDRTRSYRELTAMSGDAAPGIRALGLTTAEVGHRAAVEAVGIEDTRSGRICARPSIRVTLSASPMTVYVAREIAGDPCKEAAAREHEMKHVAVYESEIAAVAREARAALAASYGNRVLHYGSRAEADRETSAALDRQMLELLSGVAARVRERQRAVDTPEEYARVSAACGGMQVE
jgi:hypothetical protein